MSDYQIPFLKDEKLQYKKSRKEILLANYDPFRYPADLDAASKHGKARRVCKSIPIKSQAGQRCECCLLPIQNEQLPLNCKSKDMIHLGMAYPMYFQIIKMCILLLTLHFVFTGGVDLAINLTSSMCVNTLNNHSRICKMSVLNSLNPTAPDRLLTQNILNITFVLLSTIVVEGMKFRIKILKFKLTQYQQEPSDYSVMIKGFPKDITLSQTQQFMQHEIELLNMDSAIIKIYLIYDVKEYVDLYKHKRDQYDHKCALEQKYKELIVKSMNIEDADKRKKCIEKAENISQEISQTQNKVEEIEIEISKYQQAFKIIVDRVKNQESIFNEEQSSIKKVKFSGKCIVTFNQSESAAALVKKYKLTFQQRIIYKLQQCFKMDSEYKKIYKGKIIKVTKAPDPSDIIFSNMGSEKFNKLRSRILSNLIIFSTLMLALIILTFGKKISNQSKQNSTRPLMYSFVMAIIVSFFNSILGRVIRYFAQDQFYTKQSSYCYTVTKRMIIAFLLNMIMTTLFSNLIGFYLIHSKSDPTYEHVPINFQGLINDFFFLNATNPFLACLFTLIDYRYAFRMLKRFMISHGKSVTQAQANLYFEHQPIDMALRFSHIFRSLLFTAAISVFLPISLVISLVVLILVYWNDKILLLRRYTCEFKLGYALIEKMFRILQTYPILFSASNLFLASIPIWNDPHHEVFNNDGGYRKTYFYFALAAFLFSICAYYVELGLIDHMFTFIFRQSIERSIVKKTYKEKEFDFTEDYNHHYPYFRVSSNIKKDLNNSPISPKRKAIIQQTNKKLAKSVFGVIRQYMDNKRYNIHQ